MKELEIKCIDPIVELIDDHSEALNGKKLVIGDINEIKRYFAFPLYSKYTGGNQIGYDLTSKDFKYRMIVTRNFTSNGFINGYKIEKVEKILRYPMRIYKSIGKTGEIIEPNLTGDSTIADYIKADKESSKRLYMVKDDELESKWTKIGVNKYLENKDSDISMVVQPIVGDNSNIVKEISKELVVKKDLYTYSNKIEYPQTIVFKHAVNENIRTM